MMGLRQIYQIAKLAERASMDRAQLSKFFDGRARLSVRTFLNIAQVLEVHPDLLLEKDILKEIEDKVLNPAFEG